MHSKGKTPLQKNPDEVHLAIKARGEVEEVPRSNSQHGGSRPGEREKGYRILSRVGEAQLRRDAVIGASTTRVHVHPWWRGAVDSSQGTRVASFYLPLTTLHTFDIQMLTGKKTVYTRNLPFGVPGRWCPMGGLRNADLAFPMWQILMTDGLWENWAVGE